MNGAQIKSIDYSHRFLKLLSKLPPRIIEQAREKEALFRVNPFEPSLRTHKLSAGEAGCWAFRINYSYRIKFIFITQNEVLFLEVGTHNIYK